MTDTAALEARISSLEAEVQRLRDLLVGGSDGNARLTAGTAAVLSVLLVLEGLTLFAVRQLLLPHIFLGLLLIPPVLLKLASTSWRMLAYYRRVPEYVRRGPPHALLRILVAPVLVVSTIVLLASGIGAAFAPKCNKINSEHIKSRQTGNGKSSGEDKVMASC